MPSLFIILTENAGINEPLFEADASSQGNCMVPEKIHTHPMEGHWKFLGEGGGGGGGVLKAKFLEAMYENKLEFPWGRRGMKQKGF